MRIPLPFPYQGSKRHLARSILRFFPSDIETLYEPFAGSAAITIAAAYDSLAEKLVLNDFNEPLIELWRQIISQPAAIATKYARLWNEQDGQERDYYKLVKDQFNETKEPSCLLYLLARCVKASVRYKWRHVHGQREIRARCDGRAKRIRSLSLPVLTRTECDVSHRDGFRWLVAGCHKAAGRQN